MIVELGMIEQALLRWLGIGFLVGFVAGYLTNAVCGTFRGWD